MERVERGSLWIAVLLAALLGAALGWQLASCSDQLADAACDTLEDGDEVAR